MQIRDGRLLKVLKAGNHPCAELQADFDRYGAAGFSFELLEFVLSTDSLEVATARQQAKYRTRLYNPQHRPRSR